jgi:large subunit ribosomal protein L16
MLSPKRVKHRKVQKGRIKGLATRGTEVSFGDFGLQATNCGYITARQLEAARIAMTRHIKRGGKVWIRVFPDKPQTKKPLEVRMGSGKGAVEQWVVPVKPGRILYEIDGVDEATAKEAFRLAGHKLSVQVRFVKRGVEVL